MALLILPPHRLIVGDDGLLFRVRTRQQEEVNAFGSRCQLSMASWESGHCRQGLCSNHCPVLPVRHRRKPLSLPNNSSSHSPFFSLSLSSLSFSSSSSSSFCSSSSLLLSFLVCFRCLANLESRRVRRSMWSAYQAHIIKENWSFLSQWLTNASRSSERRDCVPTFPAPCWDLVRP